jgi:signal transduction histidine kinase
VDDLLVSVRAAGLPATMEVTGAPFALPATAELAVYRIIQEALTNTLKHAPGAMARIRLDYQPGQVGLEITDTGPPGGPPRAFSPTGGGHGIAGMRERAALFAGQVTAGPVPGGGWRIQATLRPEAPAPAGRDGDPAPLIVAESP